MDSLARANLFILFLVAVFDPADQVTHLKVPLFVSLWVMLGLRFFFSTGGLATIGDSLLIYIVVFSLILPVISIFSYLIRGGQLPAYDGFVYLRSFLFATLALILACKALDAVRSLCAVLTLLSCAIILMTTVIYSLPDLREFLWLMGDVKGTFALGERNYADLSYSYVYFHTSPLLVISLAYFTYRTIRSSSRARIVNFLLLLVNFVAMICSGPRNNLIFGLLTPLVVLAWYSGKRHRVAFITLALAGMAITATLGSDVVQAMFDPLNESNAIKLAHVHDYARLFSDPVTLFFGQGLGAFFYSSGFGTETSITELTYLEFIRNFGLILATVYFGMLLYPLTRLRKAAFSEDHYLILAYGIYLMICASNPLLVSSSGMLVLAIVLAKVFSTAERRPNLASQGIRFEPQSLAS